jgi:NAD binding domain of 6-phosphogluconate dehydrogenase
MEVHVDIGFIGLGVMGQPMALNLARAGLVSARRLEPLRWRERGIARRRCMGSDKSCRGIQADARSDHDAGQRRRDRFRFRPGNARLQCERSPLK